MNVGPHIGSLLTGNAIQPETPFKSTQIVHPLVAPEDAQIE